MPHVIAICVIFKISEEHLQEETICIWNTKLVDTTI